MKTSVSTTPGPDLSRLPSGVQPPRRPISHDYRHLPNTAQNVPDPDARAAGNLADLVDRSVAQIAILRAALDDATRFETAARTLSAALDDRLARCDAAGETLAKAAQAVGELNAVAGQIRTAAAAIDQRINAQLADHQRRLDALLADHEARFAARIAELESAFASKVDTLAQVQGRAIASAHNACERAIQSTRAAGANAIESARQTIAAVEEEIASRTQRLTDRLREHAASAASEAVMHVAQARELDDALCARLKQAADLVETLDRRLAEILDQAKPASAKKPPLRRAA